MLDVTKAEADALKWDAPHGAKLGVVASGSPAEKQASRPAISSIWPMASRSRRTRLREVDCHEPELRLRVMSDGSEQRVMVTPARLLEVVILLCRQVEMEENTSCSVATASDLGKAELCVDPFGRCCSA
jgi:hypothetical protein